jgi:hypothetical protein
MLLLLGAVLYVPYADAETKFDYGASFRLRQEIWDDVVDLGLSKPDRSFFRLRSSVWGKADFSQDLGAYLKLTNEMKYQVGSFRTKANRDEFEEDELIVDNLYFDAKNIFGAPVDLRIGRQDFLGPNTYGEGFLIMDGTPADGSRTFYFNAAKATVRFNQNNSVDFVYITDPKNDEYLPSLYTGTKRQMTTSNEQGYVIYGRSKINDNLVLEPYYIYKTENAFAAGPAAIPKLKLNTVGARVVATANSWKFGGEFAHQFGQYDGGLDRRGNGGYIFVSRKYDNVSLKPEFDLRYVYLSGDDPGTTGKNEAWNPLFSRNPYWNELIIYSLPNEQLKNGGPVPGYWTNMEILKATLRLNFTPDTKLDLAYQYLWAPEQSGIKNAMFSNDGTSRGHLPTAILTHKFSKNLDGMLQLEYFIPGNFYTSAADNATFFRWQLNYKI